MCKTIKHRHRHTHRGVPKPLLDEMEHYWRTVYWSRMKSRL